LVLVLRIWSCLHHWLFPAYSCSIVLIDTSTAINGKSSRNCNAPKTLEKFTVHNPLPACMRLKLLLFAASCSNPVTRRALGRAHTHDDDDDDEAIITRDVTANNPNPYVWMLVKPLKPSRLLYSLYSHTCRTGNLVANIFSWNVRHFNLLNFT